jgi:transcriptional regulator with XRE-family HTH domain
MAKSDPKYGQNPVKKLRAIIDVSQAQLADLTGISLDQIRSFEIGRRGGGLMSVEMRDNIFMSCGALWEAQKRQWVFALTDGAHLIPYQKEHFEGFKQEIKNDTQERSVLTYYLVLRFLRFCQAVPGPKLNGYFWRLTRRLNQWESEQGLGAVEAISFQLEPIWDHSQAIVRGYRKFFHLFEGEENELLDLVDAAREERGKQMAASMSRLSADSAFETGETAKRTQKKTPRRSKSR